MERCLADLVPVEFARIRQELEAGAAWPWYFMGKSGSGKTTTAAILFRYWPRHDYPKEQRGPLMIDAQTLIKAWVQAPSWGECEHARDANLLVIDDIGVREMTEAQRVAFLEIVNMRRDRPTIYTGNFEHDELSSKIGDDRIARRVINGISWRFKERKWLKVAKIIEF